MSVCCCSLAGTAACQTCPQNPFAVMSKMMTPNPTALRDIMVNTQIEKLMTNADRIRSMGNDGLAAWYCHDRDCRGCEFGASDGCHLLNWLKAPVEEGYK